MQHMQMHAATLAVGIHLCLDHVQHRHIWQQLGHQPRIELFWGISLQVNGKTFYVDKGNFEDLDLLTRLTGSSTESDGQQEQEQLHGGAKRT